MNFAPIARIILRYGIGYMVGSQAGNALAWDPDVVMMLSMALGAVVEGAYTLAKRKGWST